MKKSIIFLVIILAGLILRCYNLNSPSIGYHNMKENETLSIAQEMLRSGDYLNKRLYFENPFVSEPIALNNPQPALAAYQVIFSWKIFGENLWGARLINVLFGLGSIAAVYFLALILFGGRTQALSAAAIAAILPLGIFFSRNIQPESPALFFMLLGNVFYLKFIKTWRRINLVSAGLALSISWAYSFNFIFGVIPILFCLSFNKFAKEIKKSFGILASLLLPYLALFLITGWLIKNGQWNGLWGKGASFEIFSPSYWHDHAKVISWYITGENFTPVFSILAVLGVILAALVGSGILNRYLIGSCVAILAYGIFFPSQLYQHNFSQMPFLPFVSVASAYSIFYISQALKKKFKHEIFIYFFLCAVFISAFFIHTSLKRMHGMIFIGVDIAGESLKEFTQPNEKVFLRAHSQGYGILRYARRYGGWIDDLESFKKTQDEFGIRYVCFYPAEFAKSLEKENPPLFNYLKSNYQVKEVGFLEEPNRLFYVILERALPVPGGPFLDSFSGPKQLRTIYKTAGGYTFFYIIRPVPGAQEKSPGGKDQDVKKNEEKPK